MAVGRCATRRVGRWGKEREWTNEGDRGVKERDNIGPSNVRLRIGGGSGGEKNSFMIIENAVGGSGESVPEGPETAAGAGAGRIVRMLAKEMTVVGPS